MLEKIEDYKPACRHIEHNPPMHIVLEPGKYRHTCPGCGKAQVFTVPLVTSGQIPNQLPVDNRLMFTNA